MGFAPETADMWATEDVGAANFYIASSGGEEEMVLTMQHYVRELEQHLEECKRNNVTDTQIPEWAHQLMRDRYGMKLHG